MSTKLSSWLIFFGCLLLLCLADWDQWFLGLRFAVILFVSFLLLRDRFFVSGRRREPTLYGRLLHWFRDEA
jgi:hypothetical protein